MEVKIDFKINRSEESFKSDLEKLADKTVGVLSDVKSSGLSDNFMKVEEGMVEFGFLEDEKMQELNRDFRQKDQTTDVLSFSFLDGEIFPGKI
jgi:probable rRNA maturation factor